MAGATTYGLSLLLPNGTNRYIGLFSSVPGPSGGGTELTAAGYARVACNAWTEITEGDDIGRANSNAIEFTGFALDSSVAIEAAGIFSASNGGSLIAWVPVTPIEGGLLDTDVVRFGATDLAIFARATRD